MEDENLDSNLENITAASTVAETVLIAFFEKLAQVEGFEEIAPNLRKLVIDEHTFNELAIRTVLFPDAL